MIIIYLCECVPLFYFEIAYTKIREMNKKINKNPNKVGVQNCVHNY